MWRCAFGLKPKLLQVERWAQAATVRVIEIHPEVCFARLAGAPLTARKSSWAGAVRRRALLAEAGVWIPEDLGPAGVHGRVDDVLDSAPPRRNRPKNRHSDLWVGLAVCRMLNTGRAGEQAGTPPATPDRGVG
jgi:uncharacterized protein DUF429